MTDDRRRVIHSAYAIPPSRARSSVADAEAAKFAAAKPKKISRMRRAVPGVRLHIFLSADLEELVREAAFRGRRSLSDVLDEAVREWAEGRSVSAIDALASRAGRPNAPR
jgi:hypothetical protein